MAFSTTEERVYFRETYGDEFAVQVVSRRGRALEFQAGNSDQAIEIQASWINREARLVEIFRVNRDGTLKPTLGAEGDHEARPEGWGK